MPSWNWNQEERAFVEGSPSPSSAPFVPSPLLPISWDLLSTPFLDGPQTPCTTDFGSATPAHSDIDLSENHIHTTSSTTSPLDTPWSEVATEDHRDSGLNGKRRLDQGSQELPTTKRPKYLQDTSPSASSTASSSTSHYQHTSSSSNTAMWTDYRAPLPAHRGPSSLEMIPQMSRITLDPVPSRTKKIPRPMNEFMLFRQYYINNIHMPGDVSDNLTLSKKICMLSYRARTHCLVDLIPKCRIS